MSGKDVICPNCYRSYHSTTEAYDPDKAARGDMCRLKEPWRGYGWCVYGDGDESLAPNLGELPSVYWSRMTCPGCTAPLAPSGKLTVRDPEPELSPEDIEMAKTKALIVEMRDKGVVYRVIGEKVGMSAEWVRRRYAEAKAEAA